MSSEVLGYSFSAQPAAAAFVPDQVGLVLSYKFQVQSMTAFLTAFLTAIIVKNHVGWLFCNFSIRSWRTSPYTASSIGIAHRGVTPRLRLVCPTVIIKNTKMSSSVLENYCYDNRCVCRKSKLSIVRCRKTELNQFTLQLAQNRCTVASIHSCLRNLPTLHDCNSSEHNTLCGVSNTSNH